MFNVGDFVRFKYTGLLAEIITDHRDDSYTVWLDEDNEEGIAFEDDIILASEFKQVEESVQQKALKKAPKPLSTEELFYSKEELEFKKNSSFNPQKKQTALPTTSTQPTEQAIHFSPSPIVPTKPTNSGCYLVFHQTSLTEYTIYLVNDSLYSLSFEFKLLLKKQLDQGFNKLIPPNTYFPIASFLQEQFNDSPEILFKCPALKVDKTFKIKYQKFASTFQAVPLMGISSYAYLLVEPTNFAPQSNTTNNSIIDYTSELLKEKGKPQKSSPKYYKRANLKDLATFDNELDLHAEQLVDDTSEYTSKELFELQLEVLNEYVNKAAEMGLKEVFIIHGVGKGKLKQGVEDYLRFHNDVVSYKNEYHEKYGFGATRVLF